MMQVYEEMQSALTKNNPFMAMMPKSVMPIAEEMQKNTQTMMEAFKLPVEMPAFKPFEVPSMDAWKMPEFPAFEMPKLGEMPDMPGLEMFQGNMEALGKFFPATPVGNVSNLAAHPMAAGAASSAVGVGMASAAVGTWFGWMTAVMDGAVKAQKATKSTSVFGPMAVEGMNPMKFEWGFGNAKAPAFNFVKFEWFDFGGKKPAVPAKKAAPAKVKAAPKTASKPAAKTVVAPAERVAPAPKVKAAPKTASKPAVKTVEGPAEKVASAPNAKPAPAAAPKVAATLKAADAAPTATATATPAPAAAKPTPTPAPEPAAAAAPAPVAEVMPEDFTKPKAAEKPANPDDLKLIAGVGPKLEKVLNGLGIWTFAQISKWTPNEVAWVDDYLQFKGRIDRDDWIAQADALAAGGRDEYVKRFGKEPR